MPKTTPPPKRRGRRTTGKKPTNGVNDYVRLIKNPCNAPLVMGPAIGPNGGLVSRFVFDYNCLIDGTTNSAVVALFPGATCGNADAAVNQQSGWKSALTGTGSYATMGQYNTYVPGYSFLLTNASRCRPLAACLQIQNVQPVANIGGLLCGGNVGHDECFGTFSTASLMAKSSVVQPSSTPLEVVWSPSEEDMAPFRIGETGRDTGGRSGIFVQAANIGTSTTGAHVRAVVVWEWWPQVTGMPSSAGGESPTFSFADVTKALSSSKADWWIRSAINVAHAVSAVIG